MDIEQIRLYCLAKPAVTESLPFDEHTPVYKVAGKMFALLNLIPPLSINLKCDPELAVDLRERYPAVLPGYHMDKKHWNTVMIDGSVNPVLFQQWIDNSYTLVVEKLPKKLQSEIRENYEL